MWRPCLLITPKRRQWSFLTYIPFQINATGCIILAVNLPVRNQESCMSNPALTEILASYVPKLIQNRIVADPSPIRIACH